jgi:hypothetical protein
VGSGVMTGPVESPARAVSVHAGSGPARLRAQNNRPEMIAGILNAIDQLETPLRTRAQARAREIAAQADELKAFSDMNLAQLEGEASGTSTVSGGVFVARRDRVVDLESGNLIGHGGKVTAQSAIGGD